MQLVCEPFEAHRLLLVNDESFQLLEMLAGVAVGILAEQWLFSGAALRGTAVGILVAFIGLVGLIGAVSHNAEVLRFSIAGGILALLFCGQMMNDVGHDIKAECGLAALERRMDNVKAALTGSTEPELFAQIVSRMHELDNGIVSLDAKSRDSIVAGQRNEYLSRARQRDEDFLLEKLETIKAHVHHLLDDPISLYVEDAVPGLGDAAPGPVTNLQDAVSSVERATMDGGDAAADCGDEGCGDKEDAAECGDEGCGDGEEGGAGAGAKDPASALNDAGRVRKGENGEPCVFPVIYRGEVYNDCIEINGKAMCRSKSAKWMTCAPLEGADDEYLDGIRVIDPYELKILEMRVSQLLTVANFLDNLGELHSLSVGDIKSMITILKDAHMSFEGSSLTSLLERERDDYNGGQAGKHELLKHLADELVKEEGDSESILDRFKVRRPPPAPTAVAMTVSNPLTTGSPDPGDAGRLVRAAPGPRGEGGQEDHRQECEEAGGTAEEAADAVPQEVPALAAAPLPAGDDHAFQRGDARHPAYLHGALPRVAPPGCWRRYRAGRVRRQL